MNTAELSAQSLRFTFITGNKRSASRDVKHKYKSIFTIENDSKNGFLLLNSAVECDILIIRENEKHWITEFQLDI